MKNQSDHDLLLQIKTHVEYIREDIKKATIERNKIALIAGDAKEKIDFLEGKIKIWVGVAATIGAAIIWIVERTINFVSDHIKL